MNIESRLRSFSPLHAALVASLACLAGCSADASPSGEQAVANESDALRYGSFSFTDPAVGSLLINNTLFCTATLIDPQVVVTAAHCLNYATGSASGKFTIDLSATNQRTYLVDKVVSYGSAPGLLFSRADLDNDVAIVHLTTAVPASVAVPFAYSTGAIVSIGTPVTIYGYGCRSQEGDSYEFHKQRYDTDFENVIYSCKGDSGGPTIMKMANGERDVALVTSGWATWWPGSPQPAYGLVYAHAIDIAAQVATWAGLPVPTGGGGGGGGGASGGTGGTGRKTQ
jgi:secreted trypsin-like serine protease